MTNKLLIAVLLILFCCANSVAQKKEKKRTPAPVNLVIEDSIKVSKKPFNALAPAKAAFYSAILPGLGQAYNKKYWKIPIVYAALGTGIYFNITNNNEFNRYRDAFKSRLAGFETDEFFFDANGNKLETPRVSDDGLIRAQRIFKKNKELSLLITIGLYALNIIDANVDAHLLQYNVDENLSLTPHYEFRDINTANNVGLSLNYTF